MGKTKVSPPKPVPRLTPSLVGATADVIARESTDHAAAIDRLQRKGDLITQNTTDIATGAAGLAALTTRVTTAETNITTLQGQVSGRLLARRVFTTSGPYTRTPGTVRAIVRMSGAGGGGGGAKSISNSSVGGGGASGIAIEFMLGPDGASIGPLGDGTVTIGSAGAAGTAAPTAGGTGGDASLAIGATTYIAKGGLGGSAGSMSGIGTAGGGRVQSGSTSGTGVTQSGENGFNGFLFDATGNGSQGPGGASIFGVSNLSASPGTQPAQASGYGAGGAGGVCSGVSSCAGGQGAPPVVFIDEYS